RSNAFSQFRRASHFALPWLPWSCANFRTSGTSESGQSVRSSAFSTSHAFNQYCPPPQTRYAPRMNMTGHLALRRCLMLAWLAFVGTLLARAQSIPLPEHPRPDFQRAQWLNLNGHWQFQFDRENAGLAGDWARSQKAFPLQITVP